MADYQKMYTEMFNATTDAIEILQKAQQTTEEIYISEDGEDIDPLSNEGERKKGVQSE